MLLHETLFICFALQAMCEVERYCTAIWEQQMLCVAPHNSRHKNFSNNIKKMFVT